MHRFGVLASLLVAGCASAPNTAPIAFGVPDGMVLGRDPIPNPPSGVLAEHVVYACRDVRCDAVVYEPIAGGRFPVTVMIAGESEDPMGLEDHIIVMAYRQDKNALNATKRMAQSLDRADPDRITVINTPEETDLRL